MNALNEAEKNSKMIVNALNEKVTQMKTGEDKKYEQKTPSGSIFNCYLDPYNYPSEKSVEKQEPGKVHNNYFDPSKPYDPKTFNFSSLLQLCKRKKKKECR